MQIAGSGKAQPREFFRMRAPGRRAGLHRQPGVGGDVKIAAVDRGELPARGGIEQRQKRRKVRKLQVILVDQAGLDAAVGEHHRRMAHGLAVASVARGQIQSPDRVARRAGG
jgi:hypothetical protein